MDLTLIPTKGNLIRAKETLALSRQGYELLDKKRNILVREMMALIDRAEIVREKIREVYELAYKALQDANALKNILIPKYEKITVEIQEALGEKEREEFSRIKMIKRKKST